jgi:hypothetical protein
MIPAVARRLFLGIRIDPELKKTLEEIANLEERSVSQVCELMLRTAVEGYKREGAKHLQRPIRPREK